MLIKNKMEIMFLKYSDKTDTSIVQNPLRSAATNVKFSTAVFTLELRS